MKYSWINNNADRVGVFYLGWSCDESTVNGMELSVDYDWLLLYDYRDLSIDGQIISKLNKYAYRELFAWSFGVWVAANTAYLMPEFERKTAINGTERPVDNQYGIAKRIFQLTVRSIEQQGIDVFNERMCGDFFSSYVKAARPFAEQVDELRILGEMIEANSLKTIEWDVVLIGGKDAIIPSANQYNYWVDRCEDITVLERAPHFIVKFLSIRITT